MSWQANCPSTGRTNRSHRYRCVSACLRDLYPDALTGRDLPGRFPQLLPPFGGHVGRRALFDIGQRHRQANYPQRHPDGLPDTAQLVVAGDEVGQDKYADPPLAVIRYHCRQVPQHERVPGRVAVEAVHAPAQEVKIQQSVRLTALLQKVGDLRGNRALPRAIDPGDQDALVAS